MIKRRTTKTTAWGAGGQVLKGKKPSKASILRYLRAIEKRDGITGKLRN
jgi:hypothetical protein